MKLKIENLTAGDDTGVVLENLSLNLEAGEFLSLLGPSGCGKSTLMKTIAGILPAQSGRITLDGVDITHLPIHKRGTVVVFQDMRLFPHLSVAENVAFPVKMQGVPKAERLRQVYGAPATRQVADYFGGCVYLSGQVRQGIFSASGISCAAQVPDGDYVLMLRPNALDISCPGDYRLTVNQVSFRGNDTLVTFSAEDGTLWKISCPAGTAWKPDDSVSASIKLREPVLFPVKQP